MKQALFFTAAALAWAALATTVAARGGGGCLERGTLVATPSGPVPVEQLKPGDAVLAPGGAVGPSATVQAVTSVQPDTYCELTVDGRTLRLTGEHPVQIAPGTFRMAAWLHTGDRIRLRDPQASGAGTVQALKRVPATMPAYNLLVAPGGVYAANSIIVHNKGCFLPETLIRKADGSEVPIAALRAGDRLLAFTSAGEVVSATLREVLVREVDEYRVVRTGRVVLQVTPEHPFYVGQGTFKTIEALHVGDAVFAFDGQGLSAQRIERIARVVARPLVYTLQTDAPNTFFANSVAVHNKGGGGGHSGGSHSSFHSSSHSSSHGSHSSSGGSGSSGGGSLPMLFIVGVFVFLAVAGAISNAKAAKDEDLDFVYTPAQVAAKSGKTLKLLEFLARQDPAMAPDALRRQAQTTFLKLQECWQARAYAPMQALLLPDLYNAHCLQLRELTRNHEINVIEGVRVDRIDLVNVRYPFKEHQREFTALITATARDYYIDDRTQARLRGDQTPAQFQEFWTFQRADQGWLLREIEQSRESDALKHDNFFEQFTDSGVAQIYGKDAAKEGPAGPWLEKQVATKETRIERLLNFLVATDKLWDRQAMLETSRKVFLDLMAARESGNVAEIPASDLFPELSAQLRQEIERNKAQALTLEFRNLCVRKVELILVRNFADKAKDEFVARVRAHAQKVARQHGTVTQQDEDVTPFEQYLTLGRLDNRWKLKEVLSAAAGQAAGAAENLDEDSSPEQVKWYYEHKRAV